MFTRRVSLLILYNSKGEILLQHRTKDANYYPDFWGFFGGGIEDDETPNKALNREAKEELDLILNNIKLFKRYEIEEENGIYERFVYLMPTSLTETQLKLQQNEGQGLGFFSFEETQKLKFNPHTRTILKDVTDYLNTLT